MRPAVSNIAWDHAITEKVLPRLLAAGVRGIETAPANVSPAYAEGQFSFSQARLWRQRLDEFGFSIPSLQGVLAGAKDPSLFGEETGFKSLKEAIKRASRFAEIVGARSIVFGNPRLRNGPTVDADLRRILPRARELAGICHDHGVVLAFEPNAAAYGCSFATTHSEAVRVLREVDAPGWGLQFDLAAAAAESSGVKSAIEVAMPHLVHFHVSEKDLGPFEAGARHHEVAASTLKDIRANGRELPKWISLEMRNTGVVADVLSGAEAMIEAYQGVLEE